MVCPAIDNLPGCHIYALIRFLHDKNNAAGIHHELCAGFTAKM
jgi:hypothetical protein